MTLCKASAIYLCLNASKLFGHLFLSISLPHAKIQLNLPSKNSSAIFQSSCLKEVMVKEVLARHIQMSWNFARSFIWSNHHSPKDLSLIQSSIWARHPIFDFGHIFKLWSNYILYCFIMAEHLLGHAATPTNHLHQI